MEKTLGNTDVNGARKNVKDIVVFGNGDAFQLLCKASSQKEGWMKSTKAMEVPGGCVVQVTTHQRNHDGTNAVAEAVTFVPGVKIADDPDFGGRKLVGI
jgi:predicted RNA-binding protein with TRAM domain